MGINIGDVIDDDGDVFGDGVNVAARLESISARGGICISRQVLDLIEGKVVIACRELGRQNLKNIARPVEVFGIDLHGQGSLANLAGVRTIQRFARCLRLSSCRLRHGSRPTRLTNSSA
jgi:class 3 adenylate cyclase